MTTPQVVYQLSPEAMARRVCALCGEGFDGEKPYKCLCGHRAHTDCFVGACRTHADMACGHCHTVIVSGSAEAPLEEGVDELSGDIGDQQRQDYEEISDDIDPEAAYALQQQMEALHDPDNQMTAMLSKGITLAKIHAEFAHSLTDLVALGLVGPHLTMEVDGKRAVTVSDLLMFEGVTVETLARQLHLSLDDLLDIGATEEELLALGVNVVDERAEAATAGPKYFTPDYILKGDSSEAATPAAAEEAASLDADVVKAIESTFEQRKGRISFAKPQRNANVQLVTLSPAAAGDEFDAAGDEYDGGDEFGNSYADEDGYADAVEQPEPIVVSYEDQLPSFQSKSRAFDSVAVMFMDPRARRIETPVAVAVAAQQQSDTYAVDAHAVRKAYNQQVIRSAVTAPVQSSSSKSSSFIAAMAKVKL